MLVGIPVTSEATGAGIATQRFPIGSEAAQTLKSAEMKAFSLVW